MVIMCQSEAFPHFNNIEGKEYGPASVLLHLIGKISRKITVKPGSFYPTPKCTSTVFTIELNKNIDWEQAKKVYQLSKQLFLNRRKTIYNNLSQYLGNKDKANSLLDKCGIPANYRPEQLAPNKFLEIYLSL